MWKPVGIPPNGPSLQGYRCKAYYIRKVNAATVPNYITTEDLRMRLAYPGPAERRIDWNYFLQGATNESIDAVEAGLEPQKGERIAAIWGFRGDITLALLAHGAQVIAIDHKPYFIEEVNFMIQLLTTDTDRFYSTWEGEDQESRNAYFQPRLGDAVANIGLLQARFGDVFNNISYLHADKAYLSNCLDEEMGSEGIAARLESVANGLAAGGKIYITDARMLDVLPSCLSIDERLTEKACYHEKHWKPAVLVKNS